MKNKNLLNIIISGAITLIFIVFTMLIKVVDVAPIGPNGSSVGLSKINNYVFNSIPSNSIWDKICDIILALALLIALYFAVLGFVQMIKRKSILKLDSEISSTAILYVMMIASFVLFEIIKLNYRPVLVDGILEASYPSTHTLLVATILSSTIFNLKYLIKNKSIRTILTALLVVLISITVVGRLLAGVHWLTDVIGGLLLSAILISWFFTIKTKITSKI